jgi:hypothetical protein
MNEVRQLIERAQALVGNSYDINVRFNIYGSLMLICTVEASSFPDENYHSFSGSGISPQAAFMDFARTHAKLSVQP